MATETKFRENYLRELTKPAVRLSTSLIRRAFPEASPNHVSIAGLVGVAAGELCIQEGYTKLGIGTFVTSSALDGVDGQIARELIAEGKNHDKTIGGCVDVVSDRLQEFVAALSRFYTARKRGDKLGMWAAGLAAGSSILPSLAKAAVESQGVVVPEPKGLVKLLGTREGRVGTHLSSTIFPKAQPFIDLASTAANFVTTGDRITAWVDTKNPHLSGDKIKDAILRRRVLIPLALGILGVTGYLLYKHSLEEET